MIVNYATLRGKSRLVYFSILMKYEIMLEWMNLLLIDLMLLNSHESHEMLK